MILQWGWRDYLGKFINAEEIKIDRPTKVSIEDKKELSRNTRQVGMLFRDRLARHMKENLTRFNLTLHRLIEMFRMK